MTKQDAIHLIRAQEQIFDVARLVDVSMTNQYVPNGDDTEFVRQKYDCYAVWNKEHRCENCISAKAFAKKNKQTKFEFIDNEVYHVVAKYIEVDNTPFMLELVTKITDETLFGVYGKNSFVKAITEYNDKMYKDPLTRAYNRNYYEEQLSSLKGMSGFAMMDLDHFKEINDTYGHDAGDRALYNVASCVMRVLRGRDSVIRYGGDEFLIIFDDVPEDTFRERLEHIRRSVERLVIDDYPEMRLTVSIGGCYNSGSPDATLKDADKMLYKAKESRNAVVV